MDLEISQSSGGLQNWESTNCSVFFWNRDYLDLTIVCFFLYNILLLNASYGDTFSFLVVVQKLF